MTKRNEVYYRTAIAHAACSFLFLFLPYHKQVFQIRYNADTFIHIARPFKIVSDIFRYLIRFYNRKHKYTMNFLLFLFTDAVHAP